MSKGIKKTHEQYIAEVLEKRQNVEVLGTYIDNRTKILHKCKICGYKWDSMPNTILHRNKCPVCDKKEIGNPPEYKNSIWDSEYRDLFSKYMTEKQMKSYTPRSSKKIDVHCNICGHTWMVAPSSIFINNGCPVCSGRSVGGAPEYRNSIWSSEYKDYFSQYMTDDQMKTYTPYSSKKVEVKCPDCGRHKIISVSNLIKGIRCICRDGQSYPNKFIYSLLEQLNIEFIQEYSPKWANKKRYDMYLKKENCIIENHGLQHYDNHGFYIYGGRTFDEEKYNDEKKEELAKQNNIKYYIIIDCRYSTLEWIKQSIMNSQLPTIINFTEKDVDWNKCHKFATSNLVFTASKLWNEGLNICEIEKELKIANSTVIKYLKKGKELGLCTYTAGDGIKRQGKNSRGENNPYAKKVIKLSNMKIYGSIKQCSLDNGLSPSGISYYCKKQEKFMYYDEWLKK